MSTSFMTISFFYSGSEKNTKIGQACLDFDQYLEIRFCKQPQNWLGFAKKYLHKSKRIKNHESFCFGKIKRGQFYSTNLSTLSSHPVDTRRKLNVHKAFRRRPGRLLNVLRTFNLRFVSIGHSTNLSTLHLPWRYNTKQLAFSNSQYYITVIVLYNCLVVYFHVANSNTNSNTLMFAKI